MHQDRRKIAFELMYAEHSMPAYRFALRLCGRPEDAEDLVAGAFAKAFTKLSNYRGESTARTWLFAIILNEWRMLCRKATRSTVSLEEAGQIGATLQGQDIDLANAIALLSEPHREAFLLVKGEGLTHAEAAKVVGVPVGTMYSRVFQAIQILRSTLEVSDELNSDLKVECKREM